MKKTVISLILVLLCMALLAGCAAGEQGGEPTDTTVPASTDPDAYTQVDDLHAAAKIQQLIERRYHAEQGAFHLEVEVDVEDYNLGGVVYEQKEYDVQYGERDSEYYYRIECRSVRGVNAIYSYQNGVREVEYTYGDQKTEYEQQSAQSARDTVNALINDPALDFDPARVISITQTEPGIWEIEQVVLDTAQDREIMKQLEARYKRSVQTLTVTIKDGEILSIHNVRKIEGTYGTGSYARTIVYMTRSTIRFS